MHNFNCAYHTDTGIKKHSNQDSILLSAIVSQKNEILLAVLCDGMGGMAKGELASATVIRAFSEWFRNEYIHDNDKLNFEKIKSRWCELIRQCNNELIEYGDSMEVQLGTTMTALLVQSSGSYFIAHVGDTRIYLLSDEIEQITEDHTFVGREIKKGKMTIEQAMKDSRRNVLLQCIGVNKYVEPQFLEGCIGKGDAFLMCSDGFRHEVSAEELLIHLSPGKLFDDALMKQKLVELVEINKQRNETDNISAIYIKRI